MIRKLTIALLAGLVLFGCAKKPAPVVAEPPPPPPPAVVEPEPIPTPAPSGPSEAELLAQRIQELLNQLLQNKVYFDFDKSELKPEGKEILSQVGRMLMDGEAGKSITVRIEGHTDEMGTEEYNMALGERRAQIVMEYLEGYGVPAARLAIVSYGEEQPAVQGTDPDSQAQNRRAQFKATATAGK